MVELKVSDGTTVFTYGEDEIVEMDFILRQEENDLGTIEMGDVEIILGGGDFDGLFLGKASTRLLPLPLPGVQDNGFRAQLTFPFAVVEGYIFRETIRNDEPSESWSFTLITGAARRFLELMETVPRANMLPTSIDVSTQEIAELTGTASVKTYTWFKVWDTFINTVNNQPTFDFRLQSIHGIQFTIDVDYDDGGETKTIERDVTLYISEPDESTFTPPRDYMPDWTLRQWYDLVATFLGWRLKAEFAPFPSNVIIATVLTDRGANVSGLPDLTNEVLDSGYETGFEDRRFTDFGIIWQQGTTEKFTHANNTRFSRQVTYKADRGALDGDGKSLNQDLISLGVALPQIWNDEATDVGNTPDAGNHPNYQEDVTYASPVTVSTGQIYVMAVYDPGGSPPSDKMLVKRVPQNPAPSQPTETGEHFADVLALNYQLRRARHHIVDGAFDIDAIGVIFDVGDALKGVAFKTNSYIVRRMTVDVLLGDADLYLAEPFAQDLNVIDPTEVAVNAVRSLFGCWVDEPTGPTFHMEWLAPLLPGALGLADDYDIEGKYDAETTFTALATTPNLVHDEGPKTGGEVVGTFRVRGSNAFGKGDWSYVTIDSSNNAEKCTG